MLTELPPPPATKRMADARPPEPRTESLAQRAVARDARATVSASGACELAARQSPVRIWRSPGARLFPDRLHRIVSIRTKGRCLCRDCGRGKRWAHRDRVAHGR